MVGLALSQLAVKIRYEENNRETQRIVVMNIEYKEKHFLNSPNFIYSTLDVQNHKKYTYTCHLR